MNKTAESERLEAARSQNVAWKKWGPHLSERQWGTVREDYSENGNAWGYLSHDHARSRAYRWGEDGIAGISDDKQNLCFALALWNGKDPINFSSTSCGSRWRRCTPEGTPECGTTRMDPSTTSYDCLAASLND